VQGSEWANRNGTALSGGMDIRSIPDPNFQGSNLRADSTYLVTVDKLGILGLGKDVVMTESDPSDSLLALLPKTGQWVRLQVPSGRCDRLASRRAENRMARKGNLVELCVYGAMARRRRQRNERKACKVPTPP
jgi:hypothetical protein